MRLLHRRQTRTIDGYWIVDDQGAYVDFHPSYTGALRIADALTYRTRHLHTLAPMSVMEER